MNFTEQCALYSSPENICILCNKETQLLKVLFREIKINQGILLKYLCICQYVYFKVLLNQK